MRERFDTDDVHPRHRVDVWRAAVTDTFLPIAVDDYDPRAFSARYEAFDVGSLSLSRFSGTEQTFVRPPALIRNRHADVYVAVIHKGGRLSSDHNGRTDGPMEGSITLLDMTKPCRVHFADRLDIIDVFIPRAHLDRAMGSTRGAVGLSISPDQASAALIQDFFSGMLRSGDAFAPAVADRMATIGVDLLAAGFAERLGREPPRNEGASAVVYRAKVVIDGRLSELDLDTTAVARALRISLRRLQEAFRMEGLSVDAWIWDRRLTNAHRLLSDPACGALAISTIAYRCGFASQAHFSRRFRQRFGQSPTEARSLRVTPRVDD